MEDARGAAVDWNGYFGSRAENMERELRVLVEIESPSGDGVGVGRVARALAARLEGSGARVEIAGVNRVGGPAMAEQPASGKPVPDKLVPEKPAPEKLVLKKPEVKPASPVRPPVRPPAERERAAADAAAAREKPQRLASLDAYRGFVMLAMASGGFAIASAGNWVLAGRKIYASVGFQRSPTLAA